MDNISKTYKKQSIIYTTRSIRKLKLLQIIMEFQKELTVLQNQAFISLIDYKPNFSSNPKCRLISPAKDEIGKISKYFLQQLNGKVRDLLLVNQ